MSEGARSGQAPEEWSSAQYEREKRRFVECRQLHRWVTLHASVIFAVTWGAGWLASWGLLKLGVHHMAMRYAIAFLFSYAVFMLAVRVWADEMRQERGPGADGWEHGLHFADVGRAGEGCVLALAVWLAALAIAVFFAMTGGIPLLLEVAFEVVFAGVVVRRAARREVLGDWMGALLGATWIHAVVALFALIGIAAFLQAQVPEAETFAQAVRVLLPSAKR